MARSGSPHEHAQRESRDMAAKLRIARLVAVLALLVAGVAVTK
jgi:hypothetical protein